MAFIESTTISSYEEQRRREVFNASGLESKIDFRFCYLIALLRTTQRVTVALDFDSLKM
jgi:hypothetical protein